RDPKSLFDLAPEFLPEVPKSIFHGQPIRMRVDPEGIVESIGLGAQYKPVRRDRGVIRIYALDENGLDGGGYHSSEVRVPNGTGTVHESVFRVPPAERSSLVEEVKP